MQSVIGEQKPLSKFLLFKTLLLLLTSNFNAIMLNVLVWTLKLSFCTDCWESWLKCDWIDDKWADFYSGQTRIDPTHCRLHHQLKSCLLSSSYNPWSAEKIKAFLSLISLLHAFPFLSFFWEPKKRNSNNLLFNVRNNRNLCNKTFCR